MDSRQISKIRNTTRSVAQSPLRKYEVRSGSAIILAIILTTLLAILGVMFLLSSRVDSVATSAVGGNQDLKLAVDTVVAQISEVLTRDVPGVATNNTYYDYPDGNNPWLACLEPYPSGSDYLWRQVSNIYGYPVQTQNVQAQILPDYNNMVVPGTQADADGDGVSDSIWTLVPDINSSKGKPIYAAIRIIDNGGMLNVNTGLKFDPCTSVGAEQSEVNLMAFAALDHTHLLSGEKESRLLSYRCGAANANYYASNVVWQYGLPNGAYTPFDISDELKLRNRYIINYNQDASRIETLWANAFDGPPYVPRDTQSYSITTPGDWFWIVSNSYPSSCSDPCKYDNRHIATTYNCDRIINPAGSKMFNINSPLDFNAVSIYGAVREALDPNVFSSIDIALITANLMDYVDGPNYPTTDLRYDPNNNVTVVYDSLGTPHYGFERPCVYISEIAYNFYQPGPNSPYYDVNNPDTVYRSYAIELFKPYWEDDEPEPNKWRILTTDSVGVQHIDPIIWTGSRRFHVLSNNPNLEIMELRIPIDLNELPGPNEVNFPDPCHLPQPADVNFGGGKDIILQRDVNGFWLTVDKFVVPDSEVNGSSWLEPNMVGYISNSFERDITTNRCIRKVRSPIMTIPPTIGYMNNYDSGSEMIQAHPANKPFTNIGEIGQLFRTDAYLAYIINPSYKEEDVRLNLADPNVQNLFNYLTVMDPTTDKIDNDGDGLIDEQDEPNTPELKIKGRININTAPWFVLAQLPWLSYHTPNYELARSIVNYRDTHGAFQNIGELMRVSGMGYYQGNAIPTTLATPTDCNGDAFEERDVIFDRISNLVTVRSDVFTAYILVRIGADGPQKRVIAIFDRSNIVPNLAYDPNDNPARYFGKVKVIAIQPVPDSR